MFRFAQTETGRDLREDKGSIERGELGALWGETGSFEAGKLRNKPSILVCAILGKPQPPKNKKAPSTRAPGSNPTTGVGDEMQILRSTLQVNGHEVKKNVNHKLTMYHGTRLARAKFKL